MRSEDVSSGIATFYERAAVGQHHRYRSWEHCYRFFKTSGRVSVRTHRNIAALQLGFYLASWGMYRGSSFLLQHDYVIHENVIERLTSVEFDELWQTEIGDGPSAQEPVEVVLAAVSAVKDAYRPYGDATDTLATKVLLGTLACVPACDRYFIEGFKLSGRQYSRLNSRFMGRIIEFCTVHKRELRKQQARILENGGMHYPLMKLADMYFWETGFTANSGRPRDDRKGHSAEAKE
jgi:hypothetical protein